MSTAGSIVKFEVGLDFNLCSTTQQLRLMRTSFMFSTNFLSLLAWEGSMSCSDESLLSEGCCGVTMAGRPRFSFFCLLRKRGYSTLAMPSKKCKIIYLILVVKYIPPDNL